MHVEMESYRDEQNMIVDDLSIDDSQYERLVVLRNGDGTITVRGQTTDSEQFEVDFTVSNRQYTGLVPHTDELTHTLTTDIRDALSVVGFMVEPSTVVGGEDDE